MADATAGERVDAKAETKGDSLGTKTVGCLAKYWAVQLERRLGHSWEQSLDGWRVAKKVGSMAQTTVATWVAWMDWQLDVTKDDETAANSVEQLAQTLALKKAQPMAAMKAAMKVISMAGLKEQRLARSMVERKVASMVQLTDVPMAAKRAAL